MTRRLVRTWMSVAALALLPTACSLRDFDKLMAGIPSDPVTGLDGGADPEGGADGGSGDSGAPGRDLDLVGWWKLDEVEGTVARDSSGYGHDGELIGGVSWTQGRRDGAASFDGSGRIHVDDSADLRFVERLTVAFWVNVDDVPGVDERILRMGYVWDVKLNTADRRPQFDTTSPEYFAGFPAGLALARWYHLAFTFDGGAVAGYLDGARVTLGSNSFPSGVKLDVDDVGLTIGASTEGDSGCKCRLDDLRLYRRVLSEAEIADLAR